MSKLGGEEVNRFQWLSHSTSTKEFLKKSLGEKTNWAILVGSVL